MRMKRILLYFMVAACCLNPAGCASAPQNTVTQFSTIDALLAGVYEGQTTCSRLLEYGDFGIGTFDSLDGEMILLDGKIYQVRADGKVYRPSADHTLPFACAVAFRKDLSLPVSTDTDFGGMERLVDRAAPNMNLFCALRIEGHFAFMKVRSVPAQRKPYPPLTEVTKNQPVFELERIKGTIVGFRAPQFAKAITVPGYHLHFLSEDFQAGGHVLDFSMTSGTVEVDLCNRFLLVLPGEESSFGSADLTRDRSAELEKAEK